MFSNYRSYYNKEPEQRCMTDHSIKNNSLSSFENKQRSFSNISYMVFFTYFCVFLRTSPFRVSRYQIVLSAQDVFLQGAAQSLPRVVCPYTLSSLCQRRLFEG
jgi:hypothetical protein